MDPLTLEPYAACLRWRFPKAQALESWQALFAALLDELALACTAGSVRVIGHIKGLALLPGGGFLRGSKVSIEYPSDVEIVGASSGAYSELELTLNLLVYGLPLSEGQRLVPEIGEQLALRWDAELEVLARSAEHGAEADGLAASYRHHHD